MKAVLTSAKAAFDIKETGHHGMWCPVFWQGQKDTNPLFGGFALLDDQNLVDFGTRLRTLHLKNSPQDYFSWRCKPTLGSSPSIFQVKIKTTIRVDGHLYFGRGRRTWTLGTRFWRPLLYQLSYTPIYLLVVTNLRLGYFITLSPLCQDFPQE